ncbi:acetyl-CoA carboxylase carboxyltransferase subunit alpha [bacterium]|nr:acetyl-CoA carboxylase carboxyltransferase subunit alpha [bacterium]MCK4325781.1 acetyl-CoA carboxylase carboxyltransferase subunit alpha [bacterium]
MNGGYLDFERPIVELERKIEELRKFTSLEEMDLGDGIGKLERKAATLKREIFGNLTPWQRTQLARHHLRPYSLDYINLCMEDFQELRGDRIFSDDEAIVGGLAKLNGYSIVVIGHQKGRDTKENLRRNFGMSHPEGYRKSLRLMKLAEKFSFPVITFIDTPGAYPGVGAEERGQAEAIAENLKEMSCLETPLISVVIGEGGSGGALGLGVGNRILMLENAIYSVISPEGCAAILWKDRARAKEAAQALNLTAQDLLRLRIIDEIVPEPLGGCHRDYERAASNIKKALKRNLEDMSKLSKRELVEGRYKKYRRIGEFLED